MASNKVHELLSTKDKWTTGHRARNSAGAPCDESSPEARCWCAVGAILKCYGEPAFSDIHDRVADSVGAEMLWIWNDTHTYEDVHSAFKKLDL